MYYEEDPGRRDGDDPGPGSLHHRLCRLKFDVTDTGRGISRDALPKLFDAFQRLDEGQNRGIEGTGLGLAITKNLLDEMHGQIEVSSEYGKGSTFTIYLDQKISMKSFEKKP